MADDDISLSEKRVYEQRREATRAYVASGEPRARRGAPDGRAGAKRHASGAGVAHVDASDDQIGRFGLARQCDARDVAGGDGQLLVATDEDVQVGSEEEFEPTDFGPAVAVDVGDELLAAGEDGRVASLGGGEWETLAQVEDVRHIDGDLLATADGVFRFGSDGGLIDLGLDGVHDVAAAGPYAVTDDGLFIHDDGWTQVVSGKGTVVASDGDRAHAVVDGTLLERVDEEWVDAGAPDGAVVDVAYGKGTFAVTRDGRVLLDPVAAKDGSPGWRSRSVGLADVVAIAIP